MSDVPADPIPDDKDWTRVLQAPCPECGYDAATVAPSEIGARLRESVSVLVAALGRPNAARRPRPQVWSALEYGCHVRDVCRIFGERARLMIEEDDPRFPNWDQDETALAER
jgi:hypothetical protein